MTGARTLAVLGVLLAAGGCSTADAVGSDAAPWSDADAGPPVEADAGPGSEADAGDDAAAELEHGCFARHLLEAIALNLERKPRYAALTDGQSEPLSDRLVASEELALSVAVQIDDLARPFQEAGVPIICDEFVSMALVPPFEESFATPPPPLASYEPVDGAALTELLLSRYDTGGFPDLAEELRAQSASLAPTPSYHCMLKHVVDSLWRIASYAAVHDEQSRQAGLASTLDLSDRLVRLHLLTLETVAQLDTDAAPIQAAGVPFLCQDVPPIEPYQP